MTDMSVRVEVWPVSADDLGVWLLALDAWRSGPAPAQAGQPHATVNQMLRDHGGFNACRLLHSTSWRPAPGAVLLTYVAVLGGHGHVAGHGDFEFVREVWPNAQPIGVEVADVVGKPERHGPVDAPDPARFDVLMHAIRHLRFLLDTDVHVQAALDGHWRKHLAALEPALSGMYQ